MYDVSDGIYERNIFSSIGGVWSWFCHLGMQVLISVWHLGMQVIRDTCMKFKDVSIFLFPVVSKMLIFFYLIAYLG